MIQMLRKRLDRKDEGFTLIELMVVILIIAILMAIAIPTFLGARSRAQNRAAESNLRNALTAAKTGYTDTQSYYSSTASLASIEPSLSWVAALSSTSKGTDQVAVTTQDGGNVVCLMAQSASGNYYAIEDVAQPDSTGSPFAASGTFYGSDTSAATVCPTGNTSATAFTGAGSGDTWSNTTTGAKW